MTYTDSIATISASLLTLCQANQGPLGFEDIYDGDQNLIPRTPSLCVIAGSKTRQLVGAPMKFHNNFTVYLMIYHAEVRDEQKNYRDSMTLSEALETILNDRSNRSLSQQLIESWITAVEPGYTTKGNSLLRTTRMTWEGFNETFLNTPTA